MPNCVWPRTGFASAVPATSRRPWPAISASRRRRPRPQRRTGRCRQTPAKLRALRHTLVLRVFKGRQCVRLRSSGKRGRQRPLRVDSHPMFANLPQLLSCARCPTFRPEPFATRERGPPVAPCSPQARGDAPAGRRRRWRSVDPASSRRLFAETPAAAASPVRRQSFGVRERGVNHKTRRAGRAGSHRTRHGAEPRHCSRFVAHPKVPEACDSGCYIRVALVLCATVISWP